MFSLGNGTSVLRRYRIETNGKIGMERQIDGCGRIVNLEGTTNWDEYLHRTDLEIYQYV